MRVLSVLCSLTMLVVSAMSLTAQPAGVRLALVNVPDDVLRPLLPTFEQHKLRASIVYTRNDPFAEVATKARYVSNASAGARYLEDIALAGTANARAEGFGSGTFENAAAVTVAADRGAHVLWGVPPFLRWKRQQSIEQATDLEPLVIDDSTLQRIMVSIVVNAKAVKGVNAEGAQKLQEFLLSPAIQARIAAVRYPDFNQQVWWPAGRHNSARE